MSETVTTETSADARTTDAMIRINLLLFASVAQAVGQRQRVIVVPAGTTAREAFRLLADDVPELFNRVDHVSFACNQEFVPAGTVLADGDELAVIPPVSGGA